MSELVIQAFGPLQPPLNVEDTSAELRWWYSRPFLDSDGTQIEGGDGQNGYYLPIACSIVDGLVSIDGDFTVWTTDNAQDLNPGSITASAQLYINGAPQGSAWNIGGRSEWVVPSILVPTTTWADFSNFNSAIPYPNLPSFIWYFTAVQVIQEIAIKLAQFLSSPTTLGGVYLSAEPDDPQHPVAIGANDHAFFSGELTPGTLPYATNAGELADSPITYDGQNVSVQTLNLFQAGDYQVLQNGSFLSVTDSLSDDGGRVTMNAGGDSGNEYAGITADCSGGSAEIFMQTTGITNLHGHNHVSTLGDSLDEQQGTKLIVNDPTRMVIMTAANQVPNDLSISGEQITPYLDESNNKLIFRVCYSDGTTYKIGEISLT